MKSKRAHFYANQYPFTCIALELATARCFRTDSPHQSNRLSTTFQANQLDNYQAKLNTISPVISTTKQKIIDRILSLSNFLVWASAIGGNAFELTNPKPAFYQKSELPLIDRKQHRSQPQAYPHNSCGLSLHLMGWRGQIPAPWHWWSKSRAVVWWRVQM